MSNRKRLTALELWTSAKQQLETKEAEANATMEWVFGKLAKNPELLNVVKGLIEKEKSNEPRPAWVLAPPRERPAAPAPQKLLDVSVFDLPPSPQCKVRLYLGSTGPAGDIVIDKRVIA